LFLWCKVLNVGAVVLATGKSDQLLLPFQGKTTIASILDALETAGINVQIVVLGGNIEPIVDAIRPKLDKIKISLNLAPEQDTESSFQAGLIVIQSVDAAFLVSGDQPIHDPTLLTTMVKELEQNAEALIVSPIHNGERVYPLLFRREFFAEILSLTGNQIIHDIVNNHLDDGKHEEPPKQTPTLFNDLQDKI
jgi:molybdenum cofactor cytidylyltransferase